MTNIFTYLGDTYVRREVWYPAVLEHKKHILTFIYSDFERVHWCSDVFIVDLYWRKGHYIRLHIYGGMCEWSGRFHAEKLRGTVSPLHSLTCNGFVTNRRFVLILLSVYTKRQHNPGCPWRPETSPFLPPFNVSNLDDSYSLFLVSNE